MIARSVPAVLQGMNKVATAVQLRFNLDASAALSPEHKLRLKRLAGRRMTADGWLIIDARRYRSQDKNKEDAIERFTALVERSSHAPLHRRPTNPTVASRQKRLESKKLQSEKKSTRQKVKTVME